MYMARWITKFHRRTGFVSFAPFRRQRWMNTSFLVVPYTTRSRGDFIAYIETLVGLFLLSYRTQTRDAQPYTFRRKLLLDNVPCRDLQDLLG
jgi:hypothetical protein